MLKTKGSQLLEKILISLDKDDVQVDKIVIAVDVSGAVNYSSINLLLEEIRESLIDRYGKSDAALLYTDYDLNQNNITNLDKRSENFILIGGGGTSFKPAFKWIEENLNECLGLIYITDGYGEYPEQEPNFQVLWVLNDDCDVPFGLKFII